MAAIQLQLEMSRGLWAGRQPSSSRNTTSKTGVGKEHSSRGVPQNPKLQRGKDRQGRRPDIHTGRQKARQTHTETWTQVDRQRDKLTEGQNGFSHRLREGEWTQGSRS